MSPSPGPQEPLGKRGDQLIEAARNGCREALGHLLNGLRLLLLAEANRQLPDKLRAKVAPSSLVQQTCLEAVRDFQQFAGSSEEELKAWLLRILEHKVANARRTFLDTEKSQIDREVPLEQIMAAGLGVAGAALSPSDLASRNEEAALIQQAVGRLSPDEQKVFHVRHVEQRSWAEIAAELAITEEASRKRFARAVKHLTEIVQDTLQAKRRPNE